MPAQERMNLLKMLGVHLRHYLIGKLLKNKRVIKIKYYVRYDDKYLTGESLFKNHLSLKKAKKTVIKRIRKVLPIKQKIDVKAIKITSATVSKIR